MSTGGYITSHKFTSGLEEIAKFLFRDENINHQDVVCISFNPEDVIFEDKTDGSYIHLAFADAQCVKISKIEFRLEGDIGTVYQWIKKFQSDFGASVDQLN
jgi:hypothetical protein